MAITVIDGHGLRALYGGSGLQITPSEIASLVRPLGPGSSLVVGVGFMAAGFLALAVASMGSGWGFLDAVGSDSRALALSYYAVMGLAAVVVSSISADLVGLMLDLMAAYSLVILPSLYFLGRLISDPEVMGGYCFRRWEVATYWAMAALVFGGGLTGILLSIL
jgi:Mn2+/Fe2+ NRAMP family transporter